MLYIYSLSTCAANNEQREPNPHHVLDAELLFLQSLLEGVRLAVVSARVDEHKPPPLGFKIAAAKTCRE